MSDQRIGGPCRHCGLPQFERAAKCKGWPGCPYSPPGDGKPEARILQFPQQLPPATGQHLRQLEATVLGAINKAIDDNVPQGLIVALLHAYALQQTQRMLNGNAP